MHVIIISKGGEGGRERGEDRERERERERVGLVSVRVCVFWIVCTAGMG